MTRGSGVYSPDFFLFYRLRTLENLIYDGKRKMDFNKLNEF